jgi:Flp pilus assembly protein TadG
MVKTLRRRREGGAAAVEMALVLPILVLLIAGIIDLGRAFMAEVVLTNGAREGTRYVSVLEDPDASETDIEARAAAGSSLTSTQFISGTPTAEYFNECSSSPARYRVTVSVQFNWLMLNIIPGISNPQTMTGTSTIGC